MPFAHNNGQQHRGTIFPLHTMSILSLPSDCTIAIYTSPLGKIYLAGKNDQLTHLWFLGQRHAPLWTSEQELSDTGSIPFVQATQQWLDAYFQQEELPPLPILFFEGSPFQHAVWQTLLTIPYGTTLTYSQLAHRVAERLRTSRVAVRATATAVGRNPIALLIPCHRVIATQGLGGYAAGVERKAELLKMEKR